MKLTGPMMSLTASGSIGGLITMASWKGRPYARQLVKPSNPKSPGQVAFRAMFKFLSQQWASVSTPVQEMWLPYAQANNYTLFNAYMKANQDLWGRYIYPTQEPGGSPASNAITTTVSAAAGVKSVEVTITPSGDNNNWGFALWRNVASAPTVLQTEIIAIVPAAAAAAVKYVDLGLSPGTTYYYEAAVFDIYGNRGAVSTDDDATPT